MNKTDNPVLLTATELKEILRQIQTEEKVWGIVGSLLQQLPEEIHKQKEQLEEENYWFLIANAKNFLKNFYITIDGNSEKADLQKSVRNCLLELQ